MNLHTCFLTRNNCYLAGETMTPRGIMVHSTGANNPYLKRYVAPDDGLLGVNRYNNAWNQPMPDGHEVCVHAFIGKLENEGIATYQTLPWNFVGWHSGCGVNGNANRLGYIGFEICESDLEDSEYFKQIYKESTELCAYLCDRFNLSTADIICHKEGADLGIAEAHGDVLHWFPKHNKTMADFRNDVYKLLHPDVNKYYRVQLGAFNNPENAARLLDSVRAAGFTDAFIKYI